MSRVASLFVGCVCALLVVQVYSQAEDYSILLPDGSYKPDSLLAFAKVLKKFQDYTLPSGDAMLQKWIGKLKVFNKHLKAGDFKALGKAGHETSIILRALLPAIPDKIVHSAIESIPEMFEKQYESALNDGTSTLADVNRFVKFVAETMLTAMSKAKPTAETLN